MGKRSVLIAALFVCSFISTSWSAHAQSCTSCLFNGCHTPAVSAPTNLWGEMEPSDAGVLPTSRDSTHVDGHVNPTLVQRWISVSPVSDASGNWLFAATGYHLQIWSLADPDLPVRLGNETLAASGIEAAVTGHTPLIFSSIRTAPNNSNLFAVGGTSSAGLSILRSSNKQDPSLLFQDTKEVTKVYTANLGGNTYAFAAGDMKGNTGVRAYNMTAANNLGSACHANLPASNPCPGVHVGGVGAPTIKRATGVDGVGNFLAVSHSTGFNPGGFTIFNVADPANPVQLMSGMVGTSVFSIAMWQEGGSYFVAVRTQTDGRIYNVSCIANGACAAPGSPIWSLAMPDSTLPTVTLSRSNGVPVLYWARGLFCGSAGNRELLQDVRNASNPVSLIEPDYFNHYYWDTPTGFNFFAPMEGQFIGSHFYRAGYSMLDVHRWGGTGPPPVPTIGSVSASPNPASTCQDVTFTGNNVTNGFGANYIWQVRTSPGLTLVDSDSGTNLNPFVWETESITPGQYVGFLVVQNGSGPSNPAQSSVVTVTNVAALPGAFTFAPTKVNDSSGAVTFDVQASGASEWSWDFGEGAGFGPWISDPINGPRPTHVFSATGTKTIKVQVRNCASGPVTSGDLVIDVPVVNPLVANFAFTTCVFGQAGPPPICPAGILNFADNSTGAQTWDYDWDCRANGSGCNTFENSGNSAPVISHNFQSSGTFTPQLRVKRGAEQHVYTHSSIVIEGSSPPPPPPPPPPPTGPSVNISGPTAGTVNSSYNFTASASNCTPAANGWTWTHNGTGVSTSSSISITWGTTGTKNITASNSACSGASDSHNITLGGGAALAAAFTAQVNGLAVSFNATASTGSPTSYLWNFGDGQSGSGVTTQHTYAAAGSYTVVLSVSKSDAGCTFGVCNSERSQVVQVGGGTATPTPTPTPPAGICEPDADTFCALNGDFQIEVTWEKKNGETGVGKVVSQATSDNTGIFYFFEDQNWELLLKVLDACSINQRFWVFGGAATDVKYQIKVTDLVTDDVWTYDNPLGQRSDAITDTSAFATCSVDRNLMRENARAELAARICVGCPGDGGAQDPTPTATPTPSPSPTVPPNVGPCDPNTNTLCAISERFRVKVNWKTKSGSTGDGAVVPSVTDNTGVFWFFQQENWELLIKVLNGCALNNHFWVFGAGATDVNYVVTVEDLATGATWEYENPLGQASPAITDTAAFATCNP